MVIIPMEISHLGFVLDIERSCFNTPWSYDDFSYEINVNDYGYYYSMLLDKEVIGFIGSNMIQDQCQITTFAINKKYQGYGYGGQLLSYFIDIAFDKGFNSITLEVRVSNVAAINTYLKYGFKKATIRKNYYQDNNEDAYLMIKEF